MAEISNGNQLDKTISTKAHVKSSKFPIKQELKHTYPFGLIGINMRFNGIAADRVRTRNVAEVRSYTIGTPLMDAIFMNKTFIQVPRMAILPLNWEKLYRQPAIGDDIDQAEYGTSLKASYFNNLANTLINSYNASLNEIENASEPTGNWVLLKHVIRSAILLEAIFSKGSLLNQLGCKLWKRYKKHTLKEIDEVIETIASLNIGSMTIQNPKNLETRRIIFPKSREEITGLESNLLKTINEFLFEIRDGENFTIIDIFDTTGELIEKGEYSSFLDDETITALKGPSTGQTTFNYNQPIDLARLWAYQLACAEYFTNDKVDHIYSAELYRQYIRSLEMQVLQVMKFRLNGIEYEADTLCAYYFNQMTNRALQARDWPEEVWAYFFAIFKYNRSLKFKDYFTGARTRPLAIGDTSIPVQGGESVDVVDVTKNIQWQRFLNIVEKIPQNLAGYTRGIMGTNVAPDYHNPLFLGTTTEQIYGQETENTAEAQQTKENSVTTNLKNGSAKYEFGYKLDRDSIILGLVWFDIERNYTMGVERNFMHVDRMDRYNPYMQYTGDQAVYAQELDASMENENFGYQGAYQEFKQEYAEASGGFATKALAGWSFTDFYSNTEEKVEDSQNITPDFIRSKPTELDNFFINLSGHSLGNYFHFIVRNVNFISATRPMSINPGILG